MTATIAAAALLWVLRRITRATETPAERARRETAAAQRAHHHAQSRFRPEQVRR